MRTCQPHISISWNFPPPLSPLISSISFGLTHTASFTMDSLQDHCSRYRASQGRGEEPDDRCPAAPALEKGYHPSSNTGVTEDFLTPQTTRLTVGWRWTSHLLWEVTSGLYFPGIKVPADSWLQVRWASTQANAEGGAQETPSSKMDPSSCQFSRAESKPKWQRCPRKCPTILASLSHQRSHHIEHLWGMFN